MNRFKASQAAFALAAVVLSTNCLTNPPGAVTSIEGPSAQKRVAFHVTGFMKTKSSAT